MARTKFKLPIDIKQAGEYVKAGTEVEVTETQIKQIKAEADRRKAEATNKLEQKEEVTNG